MTRQDILKAGVTEPFITERLLNRVADIPADDASGILLCLAYVVADLEMFISESDKPILPGIRRY